MPEAKPEIPPWLSSFENGLKPLTVTIATARKISGLGNTTIWALIKDRKLDTTKIGRRRLVIFRSLEAILTSSPAVDPHKASSRK